MIYKYFFILFFMCILFYGLNIFILFFTNRLKKSNKIKWNSHLNLHYVEMQKNIDPKKSISWTSFYSNILKKNRIQYTPIQYICNLNNEYILPKVIYTFWDKESKLINSYVNTWNRNIPKDWTIEFVNNQNLTNYVDDEFYHMFQNLKKKEAFRFADFLRFYLLIKNGGVWMDASTIVVNGQFLDDYYNEMHRKKADLLLYELDTYSVKDAPYLENWFLMAPKNSIFCIDIYNEFQYSYIMGFSKYKIKILKPIIYIKNTLPYKQVYFMQHAIIVYLLSKKTNYNYIVKNALESMIKLYSKYNWDVDKMNNHILSEDLSDMYAIKINSQQRKGIKDVEQMIQKLDSI